jgi:hypothetical protein
VLAAWQCCQLVGEREIGDRRYSGLCIAVVLDTFVPLPYEQGSNSVLAVATRTYPNVVLAN